MKYRIVTARLDRLWGFEAEVHVRTYFFGLGKEVWQRVPMSFALTVKDCQETLFKLRTGIIVL